MKKFITFGNWNKSYFYIINSCISAVAFDILNGFGYNSFYALQLSDSKFNVHIYIHKLSYYLLKLICSFLFYLYENKRDKIKNDNENNKKNVTPINNTTIELIHNDININDYIYTKISDNFVIWIMFLYVLFEYIDQIARQYFPLVIFGWLNY